MQQKQLSNLLLKILRWIAFLPCALTATFPCWYVVILLNRITMTRYADPDSFSSHVFLHVIGSLVVGVVLVYVSAFIAPNHKKHVAVVVAGLAIFASGALILASLLAHNYWAVFNNVFMDIGAIGMAYSIFNGDTDPRLPPHDEYA